MGGVGVVSRRSALFGDTVVVALQCFEALGEKSELQAHLIGDRHRSDSDSPDFATESIRVAAFDQAATPCEKLEAGLGARRHRWAVP